MPQAHRDFTSTSARGWNKVWSAMPSRLTLLVLPAALACTPAPSGAGAVAPPSSDPGETPPGGAPALGAEPTPGSPSVPGGEPVEGGSASVMPDTEPDPARGLPEISVRTVGLHIGGGPNDKDSKAPFIRAVESQFAQFLGCYKKVEQPGQGGTYGVDLFIRREGGAPEVRQPRTAMKGEEFRSCVRDAFAGVSFERPAKGPTVISYSVRFEVNDPTGAE